MAVTGEAERGCAWGGGGGVVVFSLFCNNKYERAPYNLDTYETYELEHFYVQRKI